MKTLPKLFYSRLEQIYPKDICVKILEAISKPRSIVSFRINHIKSNPREIDEFLIKNSIDFKKIKDLNDAYAIDKKHDYFLKWSEIFYSGKIYIQSLSSMIPAIILEPNEWEKILDVTAAPWSKTTQIADIMKNSWEIFGIEQNQIRFDKLNYNIKLQWVINTTTYKTDANKIGALFKKEYFDKILLDAPCSAEWRIDLSNEKTFSFWNIENIKKKKVLQIQLIETVIPLLKNKWILVYSTCTMAPEENEEVISYILEKYPEIKLEKIELKINWLINWIREFSWNKYFGDTDKTLRIIPTNINEWFFVAKLKKS